MNDLIRRAALFTTAALVLATTLVVSPKPSSADARVESLQDDYRVLVFSRTAGFRHDSIDEGVAAIQTLGGANGFEVDATEDPVVFTDEGLDKYAAVIFLNTTGDVLSGAQQAAFERYIRAGRGFVGIHSAADTEYGWLFYGGLVGAYFESHPPGTPRADVLVADRLHPSAQHLPARWARTDEWYNYQTNPRGEVHVLATLDTDTYAGSSMGADHPIAWCHDYEGGRSFYTGGGHTPASFQTADFRQHLLGGIQWAAGVAPGDCAATLDTSFERTILDDEASNPIDLTVLPDLRVLYLERSGALRLYDPATNRTSNAGAVSVSTAFEDGLLGVALDPDFATNSWLYLFYSPAGSEAKQHVSRFTFSDGTLDLASEKILLEIPTQRDECCHSGGSLTFDSQGLLYAATGDDTNPFASDGYAPLDERSGRRPWDAQRTSGNPFDLRGKILRIRPLDDGTMEIPDGNLFPRDGSQGHPAVYVMGTRNPFRISMDLERDWLYFGEVGPDARTTNASRGPLGYDEWNQVREAGNYGWPFCSGPNTPYRDFSFATNQPGSAFECSAPVNTSANVAQAPLTLPAAQPAWIWYPYGPSAEFPSIPTGDTRTAIAGPVFRYDEDLAKEDGLPAYFDGSVFLVEWTRNFILEAKVDDDGGVLAINPFVPDLDLRRPIAMKQGPDGALYMVEWGTGFGGDNPDARLSKISYVSGQRSPIAITDVAPLSGAVPLRVDFSAQGSTDPDSSVPLTYAWDFDGDGTDDASGATASFTYQDPGTYSARLTLTDGDGNETIRTFTITAGNTAPSVTLTNPPDGGFFNWSDIIGFEVAVEDAEDGSTAAGTLDCSLPLVQPLLGHDDHAHPLEQYRACDGPILLPTGHGGDADRIFYVVEASYTDQGVGQGSGAVGSLTGRDQVVLRPSQVEAEHYDAHEGIILEGTGDVIGGGQNIGFIAHNDRIMFERVNLTGIDFMTFRVASAGVGGRIEIRVDGPSGALLNTAYVRPTGDWQRYRDVTVPITDPGGTRDLHLVFVREPGNDGLFNINWIRFHGPGVATEPASDPSGLSANYYASTDLSGAATERTEPQVSFEWDDEAPIGGVPGQAFSAQWTGTLVPEIAGAYRFSFDVRGAVRLYVGEQLVIDRWGASSADLSRQGEVESQAVTLGAEPVAIRVDYAVDAPTAWAELRWRRGGATPTTVPERVLRPTPTGTSTASRDPALSTLALAPIYPNPATDRAATSVELAEAGPLRVAIYDLLGRQQAVLIDAVRPAGTHPVVIPLDGLPSGVYVCRAQGAGHTSERAFVVAR